MRTYLAVVILGMLRTLSFAATAEEAPMMLDEALRQHLLLVAIAPDYPGGIEWHPIPGSAREYHRPTGKGVFDLRFDYETGHLREVRVVQSTGSRSLDGHSIGALKLWKAKPRSIRILRVPIDFRIIHKWPN